MATHPTEATALPDHPAIDFVSGSAGSDRDTGYGTSLLQELEDFRTKDVIPADDRDGK